MDRHCLWSPHDVERHGLMDVAAKAFHFEVAIPGIKRVARRGRWLRRTLKAEQALIPCATASRSASRDRRSETSAEAAEVLDDEPFLPYPPLSRPFGYSSASDPARSPFVRSRLVSFLACSVARSAAARSAIGSQPAAAEAKLAEQARRSSPSYWR
jgi:hypothetical protein